MIILPDLVRFFPKDGNVARYCKIHLQKKDFCKMIFKMIILYDFVAQIVMLQKS